MKGKTLFEISDAEYSNLYNNLIPELDIVLWLIKDDDHLEEQKRK